MLLVTSSLYCPGLVQSALRQCEYADSSDDSSYSPEEMSINQSPRSSFDIENIDIEDATIEIPRNRFLMSGQENVRLFFDKDGFCINRSGFTYRVSRNDTDRLFHDKKVESIYKFTLMHKFKLVQFLNGDIIIKPQIGLNGGGPGGATAGFYTGKFAVHLTAQAGIAVVATGAAIAGGPAAGVAVGVALEKTIAPTVEVASNVVGLGTGILGGVATGPG